jgi:hypothetical protein
MTSEVHFLHVKSNKILQHCIVLGMQGTWSFFKVLIASEKSGINTFHVSRWNFVFLFFKRELCYNLMQSITTLSFSNIRNPANLIWARTSLSLVSEYLEHVMLKLLILTSGYYDCMKNLTGSMIIKLIKW